MTDAAEEKVRRGQGAEALLENSVFRDAMAGLDLAYIAAWRAATTPEAREDCHRYITLVERLQSDIRSIAHTGQLERARLKELEGRKKGLFSL